MELTVRQKEIVDASMEVIAELGVQHLTIKNIALRVGVTEAAIYRHFPGKLEILMAILAEFRQHDGTESAIRSIVPPGTVNYLEKFIFSHLERFTHNPALAAVIFSEEIFQNEEHLAKRVASIMEENHAGVVELVERAQKEGGIRTDLDAVQVTNVLLGTIRFLVNRWHVQGHAFSLEEEGRKVWKTLEKMLT